MCAVVGALVQDTVKGEDDTDRLVNNKVFSDTIQNFSTNPYRRVDLTALISNSVDHNQASRTRARTCA